MERQVCSYCGRDCYYANQYSLGGSRTFTPTGNSNALALANKSDFTF